MGDVINLRRVRKARARQSADADAAARRLKHGRTRAERLAQDAEQARNARVVDGARRDREAEESHADDR